VKEPQDVYERRRIAYEALQAKQKQMINRLSNYRLITVILGLAAAFVLYRNLNTGVGILSALLVLILFVFLAVKHRKARTQLRYSEILTEINRKGIKRLSGEWVNFADSGAEFEDVEHPYASDLDLLGNASIFQWINSAHTPAGREALRNMLKNPYKVCQEIVLRQEAVLELGLNLAWRQHFEAEGVSISDKFHNTEPLLNWAGETHEEYLQPVVKFGMRIIPAITILMVLLFAFKLLVPWQVPALLVGAQILLLKVYGKERSRTLSMVYRYEASLKTYAELLNHLERKKFKAEWLKKRQQILRDEKGNPAYKQIQKLSKLAEWISNRENAMFLFINILTLWDYQCMIELEKWKNESGKLLKIWLEAIAEVEALSSLSNIRFDNPEWAIPKINNEQGGLSALELVHPLLTRNRVSNDFSLKDSSGIVLITGSNMSGKSTFLRTVGSNLVLAYTGAPVCAKEFSCSIFNLWTCMRVSDNLEQSISSFYAEILRIKRIVEASKIDKPVFFLLDEIFKGTNSHDRHQGAIALINQLQKEGAMGLVSTHDLELGELERVSNGRIKNYHFREYYENQEIRFDYLLRPGISTTRNALYLIQLAGIEIEQ
jgi:DNA mismatch repair ATPase MutS